MKYRIYLLFLFLVPLFHCSEPGEKLGDEILSDRVSEGIPESIRLTCYNTTLLANGQGKARLRIAVSDSLDREITTAMDTIRLYVSEGAFLYGPTGELLTPEPDTVGKSFYTCCLQNGLCYLELKSGTFPCKVRLEAKACGLWDGSHEVHIIPADFKSMQPDPGQIAKGRKISGRMTGADISFLPQLEDEGRKFYENVVEKDAIEIFRNHGFNYIRLRLFVDPGAEKGYAPGKDYCGLSQTLAMARRVREAGMKILLDFHYSDYWADPQQQFKPASWMNAGFTELQDSVRYYTERVLQAFQSQGTLPDMVQVGNEINHGILWPDGHIGNPDGLAALLMAGVEGVRAVDTEIPVMMHLALGGQNEEAVFWLDNMIARGVEFDLIGLSYYPRWHGTLKDLDANLRDLIKRYKKPVNVVEYSGFKKEVNEIVPGMPDGMGQGTCVWEPLNWHTDLFDQNGEVTDVILLFDQL